MKNKICLLFVGLISASCSGFLDLKPDQQMVVPSTVEDCDLLLNDYTSFNTGYPTFGEIGTDDHFLREQDWRALSEEDERGLYIWSDSPIYQTIQWQLPYKVVYLSNQVLDVIGRSSSSQHSEKYGEVKGAAHFYRAFAYHQLTGVFAPPYAETTADSELGLPLRLTPNLDEKSTRGSLKQTYTQIEQDYKQAVTSLPLFVASKGRPNRVAAYGALARLYLDMADYERAYLYADSSLRLKGDLLDYNALEAAAELPINRFNDEVIFPAASLVSGALGQSFCRIDSSLYQSYCDDDLRKQIFFRHNDFDPGTYAFKGSYDASPSGLFVGLTTSEILLIRSEAAVRTNRIEDALSDLNRLLEYRWRRDTFTQVNEVQPRVLLALILDERRKELVFRGRRWPDLKRLNQDERFAKTLKRKLGDMQYTLEPNEKKYAVIIPQVVIEESGIEQNKR